MKNSWYGENVASVKKRQEYNLINYQCNGTGILMANVMEQAVCMTTPFSLVLT